MCSGTVEGSPVAGATLTAVETPERTSRPMRRWFDRTRSRWTHRHHALPDFLILGAQKAGTTSLFVHLQKFPQVVAPSTKELHFFSEGRWPGTYADQGLGWYRSQFPLRAELRDASAITGEATPRYLFEPLALRRAARHLPDSRWIIVLRDPVERALSQYAMLRGKSYSLPPLPKLIERELEARRSGDPNAIVCNSPVQFGLIGRGCYTDQLRLVQQLRSTRPTLVLFSEHLFEHDRASFDLTHDYLGLPGRDSPKFPHRYRSQRSDAGDDDLRRLLAVGLGDANAELPELLRSEAFLTVDPADWPDWVTRSAPPAV